MVSGQVRATGQVLYARPVPQVVEPAVRWSEAIVTAANAKLSFHQRPSERGPIWFLVAQDLRDGNELWAQPLPAEPVRFGLAVDAQGRIVVAMRDGHVAAFGKP